MPFWAHLEELRWVLFKCVCALLVGTLIGLSCTTLIYRVLLYPVRDFVTPALRAGHFPERAGEPIDSAVAAAGDAPALALLPDDPSLDLDERLRRHGAAIAALEARLAQVDKVQAAKDTGQRLQIVYTSPTDPFMIRLKLAFLAGVGLAVPAIAFFIWSFVAPGLRPNEQRQVKRTLRAGTLLFFAGAVFGYAFLPLGIPALMTFSAPGIAQYWPLNVYIGFCTRLILSFAIAFELPAVLGVLVRLDLVDVRTLQRGRPYALITILLFAALLTPPDVLSQAALAIPMVLLYEIGIIAGRRQQRQRLDQPE